MAFVDGLRSASIHHRPSAPRTSLAAPGWTALDIQEVHRVSRRSGSLNRTRLRYAAAGPGPVGSLTVCKDSDIAIVFARMPSIGCEQPQEPIISRYLKGWDRQAIRTDPIETPLQEAAHRLPRAAAPSR